MCQGIYLSCQAVISERVFGNAGLSLVHKVPSGYWSVNDPTNGFVAISVKVLRRLEIEKLANSYFFESDMLFRLAILRGRVSEFPMEAKYGDEISNLSVLRALITFSFLHLRNFFKRIIYLYYLREWYLGSIELPSGLVLFFGGIWFGLTSFIERSRQGQEITSGESVATAIADIPGFQLILSFLA